MRFRYLGLMVVVLLLFSNVGSGEGETRIVAFGGKVQKEYEVPEGTFAVLVEWSNIIYRENSTMMVRVLPTDDNDLYLDDIGKQNSSYTVEVSISNGEQLLLDHYTLSGGHYSPEVHVESGERVKVVAYIHTEEPLPQGRYCMMFLVASNEYADSEQMGEGVAGVGAGAKAIDSLSTKQYVVVGPPLPEPEPSAEGGLPGWVLIYVGVSAFAILIGVVVLLAIKKRQSVVDE